MIKLDRKRRKPKKEEDDEEQERTEVDFTSDAFVGKLEGSDNGRKGGLGKAIYFLRRILGILYHKGKF